MSLHFQFLYYYLYPECMLLVGKVDSAELNKQWASTTSQVVGQALGINAVWFPPEQATVKGEA